jgi:hypothetical protein
VDARLVEFGLIEVGGRRYPHDVVIERGVVRKRRKKPSRPFRDRYGHTPLSVEEAIPWHRGRLIVGTGEAGMLPVMADVLKEARRRGIELVTVPTEEACRLLREVPAKRVNAILHVSC